MDQPSFTCPRCGRTSYNPADVKEGYCGNCHDWTRGTERRDPD
jgi:ribosomal protein L37E